MLNRPYFYNKAIKKIVTVFGTLFNDIEVAREGADGELQAVERVPIAYGPKQKFLVRAQEQPDLDSQKIAIKLPRMSFEITSLAFDPALTLNQNNYARCPSATDSSKASKTRQAVAYLMGMQLNILARNQSDALQILEQILPVFAPSYTVSVKGMETPTSSTDIPFTLTNVTLNDDYAGDFKSTRRTIIYTLDFSIPVKFYTAPDSFSVIRNSTALVSSTDTPAKPITEVAVIATPDATAENPESITTIDDSFGF